MEEGPTATGRGAELGIRLLAPDDLPAVGVLFLAHTGRPADLERIGRWLEEAPGAAAVEAGTLVGCAFCRRFAPDVAEVANLLVTPSHRGRGVGRALLAATEGAAAQAGYRAMIVVQSSLYRAGPGSSGAAPGPGRTATDADPGVGRTGTYARHGYREVLSTGPTVVSVKDLGGE